MKLISSFFRSCFKFFIKVLHDFVLIFYDDLEFKAMSLPRMTIGILTFIYIANWVLSQFYGKEYSMDSFPMVYATAWGAYSVKAWKRREHHGHFIDPEVGGEHDGTAEYVDEP